MNEPVFKKEYLCIVEGFLNQKSGIIDLPISRKPGSIIERCVDSSGQPSRTIYKVVKEFEVNFGSVKEKFLTLEADEVIFELGEGKQLVLNKEEKFNMYEILNESDVIIKNNGLSKTYHYSLNEKSSIVVVKGNNINCLVNTIVEK